MPTKVEDKLDEIIDHLRRLDSRDKVRMWGGFVKALITLIPLILFLWSGWYFATHFQEFMKMIGDQAASSAANYSKTQSESFYDQMMKQYSIPKQ